MKINTEQILQIASQMESQNNQLKEELEKSKNTVASLSNTWTGEAANSTIEAYNSFANNFFQKYYDVIDQYVKFLKTNVAQGYEEGEKINKSLSENFK